MKTFLRENGLSVFFATIFAGSIAAQSFAGQRNFSAEQREHGGSSVSWWEYVTSVDFWGAVMENWQSEFLQFTLMIVATVWLVQRGSTESKKPDEAGPESDADARVGDHAPRDAPRWAKLHDWRLRLYENSLGVAMLAIFLASWFAQSLTNWRMFDDEQQAHGEATITWLAYLRNADFWNRTLQNWQSEFLAVATMAAFSIYLRQRGSPESKPVGAPHHETGSSG